MRKFNFDTFDNLRDAEIFATQFYGKKHLISYSEYWKCWIVSYYGKAKSLDKVKADRAR